MFTSIRALRELVAEGYAAQVLHNADILGFNSYEIDRTARLLLNKQKQVDKPHRVQHPIGDEVDFFRNFGPVTIPRKFVLFDPVEDGNNQRFLFDEIHV
jgi:hypothetical protein